MLTWHLVHNTEIPVIVILVRVELSRLNILNRHLHSAAATLSQANFFWVCWKWCLLHSKTQTWSVGNEMMVAPCSFKCTWCSKSWLGNSVLLATSSELTNEVIPQTLVSANSNNCFRVRIWFEKGRLRLVCAASLLMVPPTP